jgi:hypothetical protein
MTKSTTTKTWDEPKDGNVDHYKNLE